EGRAPVVHDERDVAPGPDGLEPGVEVARMIGEAIRARRRLAGVAHADEVGGQASALRLHVANDVAPEVGGGRVAVEEHHRIAPARVHVGHLGVQDTGSAARVGIRGGDGRLAHEGTSLVSASRQRTRHRAMTRAYLKHPAARLFTCGLDCATLPPALPEGGERAESGERGSGFLTDLTGGGAWLPGK